MARIPNAPPKLCVSVSARFQLHSVLLCFFASGILLNGWLDHPLLLSQEPCARNAGYFVAVARFLRSKKTVSPRTISDAQRAPQGTDDTKSFPKQRQRPALAFSSHPDSGPTAGDTQQDLSCTADGQGAINALFCPFQEEIAYRCFQGCRKYN